MINDAEAFNDIDLRFPRAIRGPCLARARTRPPPREKRAKQQHSEGVHVRAERRRPSRIALREPRAGGRVAAPHHEP